MIEGTNSKIIGDLNSVDWDFPGSSSPSLSVHALHWFPGNFIPQIPSYLISILSQRGDIVLDPFCGTGTTGVEAIKLGRISWLSDVNHASVQVAKGKIAITTKSAIELQVDNLLSVLFWDRMPEVQSKSQGNCGKGPGLEDWYAKSTLDQLRQVWHYIEGVTLPEWRATLEMVFSDLLFYCASPGSATTKTGGRRRHHWGWIADNVRPAKTRPYNAIRLFKQRLELLWKVLQDSPAIPLDSAAIIKREDVRSVSGPDQSVDLIVTSPPYLGMIDYTLANRLNYLWHNWPLKEDLHSEIGARRYRNRATVQDEYLNAMNEACFQMHRVLKPGGICAIILGSSRKFPQAVEKVLGLFSRQFSVIWGPRARTSSRRRVSNAQGNTFEEFVFVFRK